MQNSCTPRSGCHTRTRSRATGPDWPTRILLIAATVFATFALPRSSEGQAQPSLEVWVLTFGPGEPVFLKFGHNAILVRGLDPSGATRFERVYDYGLFDGRSPTLVADFLQGRMRYWMGVTVLRRTMSQYKRTNRDVYAQKLRLSQSQALDLFRRLQENAKPENREYRYDYYYDNCSTRVRDALDVVTDGAVKAGFTGAASMSLRDHSLRHTSRNTANDWMYYLGLDVGLANVDQPIDVWVESFLPFKLREGLRAVQIDVDGTRQPLVEKEEVWFKGTRPNVPERAPSRGVLLTFVGLVVGVFFAGFGWVARRSWFVRILFRAAVSTTAFGLAVFGILLVFLWGFTDHSVAYANQNIFNLAPWAILTPVVAIVARRQGHVLLYRWLGSAAAFSLLGLLLKVLPGFGQDTLRLIGLLLPIWGGMAIGAWLISQSRPGEQTPAG